MLIRIPGLNEDQNILKHKYRKLGELGHLNRELLSISKQEEELIYTWECDLYFKLLKILRAHYLKFLHL